MEGLCKMMLKHGKYAGAEVKEGESQKSGDLHDEHERFPPCSGPLAAQELQ